MRSGNVFDGFTLAMMDTGEAIIRVRYGGSGPPLLLLRAHPQTHVLARHRFFRISMNNIADEIASHLQ